MAIDPTDPSLLPPPVPQAPTTIFPYPPAASQIKNKYPQGFMTPAAIQSMYDYSKALLKSSQEPVPGTKGGWTVGVKHLVDALVGGKQAYDANQAELQAASYNAGKTQQVPGTFADTPGQPKIEDAPSTPKATLLGGALASLSPEGAGLRPTSLYTKDSQPPSAEPSSGGAVASYAPASGNGAVPPMPENAPEAVVAALAKGGGIPSKGPVGVPINEPGKPPAQLAQNELPGMGSPIVAPWAIQRKPAMTREQYETLIFNPWLSPEERKYARDIYMNQNAPIQVPHMGSTVTINPKDWRQQQVSPGVEKGTLKLPEGYETNTHEYIDPRTNRVIRMPVVTPDANGVIPPVKPRSDVPEGPGPKLAGGGGMMPALEPPAPSPPPRPTPPLDPFNTKIKEKDQGRMPAGAPFGAKPVAATGIDAPVKVASIDGLPSKEAVPPAKGVTGDTYSKMAEAAPPGVPQQDWDLINIFRQKSIEKHGAEATAATMGKEYADRFTTLQKDAYQARELRPLVDMARNILSDPKSDIYTGVGANQVLDWQKTKAAVGHLFGDEKLKQAGADNQIFRKLIAGSILSQLKPMTQGTGQIRNKEIELIERYNANPLNTIAANRALLEIGDRNLQRMDMFASMAADYASGMEVVNPLNPKELLLKANTDPNGEIKERGGLNFGWDRLLSKFIKENPAFSEAETKQYMSLLDKDKEAKGASANEKKWPVPATKYIEKLNNGGGTPEEFDTVFGPGSAAKHLKSK